MIKIANKNQPETNLHQFPIITTRYSKVMRRRNTLAQINKRAKQIRKKGEKWTDAIKRASNELKSKKYALGQTSKTSSYSVIGLGDLKQTNNSNPNYLRICL